MAIYGWLFRIFARENPLTNVVYVCFYLQFLKSDPNTQFTTWNDYIRLNFQNACRKKTPLQRDLCLCASQMSKRWTQHWIYYVEWLYTAVFWEYLPGETPSTECHSMLQCLEFLKSDHHTQSTKETPTLKILYEMTIHGWLSEHLPRETPSTECHSCLYSLEFPKKTPTLNVLCRMALYRCLLRICSRRNTFYRESFQCALSRISRKWPPHSNYYVEWLNTADFWECVPGETPSPVLSMSVYSGGEGSGGRGERVSVGGVAKGRGGG